jgi:hypothetical protein
LCLGLRFGLGGFASLRLLYFCFRAGPLKEVITCLGLGLWLWLISVTTPEAHQTIFAETSTASILVPYVPGVKPI